MFKKRTIGSTTTIWLKVLFRIILRQKESKILIFHSFFFFFWGKKREEIKEREYKIREEELKEIHMEMV